MQSQRYAPTCYAEDLGLVCGWHFFKSPDNLWISLTVHNALNCEKEKKRKSHSPTSPLTLRKCRKYYYPTPKKHSCFFVDAQFSLQCTIFFLNMKEITALIFFLKDCTVVLNTGIHEYGKIALFSTSTHLKHDHGH